MIIENVKNLLFVWKDKALEFKRLRRTPYQPANVTFLQWYPLSQKKRGTGYRAGLDEDHIYQALQQQCQWWLLHLCRHIPLDKADKRNCNNPNKGKERSKFHMNGKSRLPASFIHQLETLNFVKFLCSHIHEILHTQKSYECYEENSKLHSHFRNITYK